MSRKKPLKRTLGELHEKPKPGTPSELAKLSAWYFGAPLNLSRLNLYPSYENEAAAHAQYEVAEEYNTYHGRGWIHGENCCQGYDYSRDFWEYVIGRLYCGGIAARSYGQAYVKTQEDADRLERLAESIRTGAHP